MEQQGVHQIGTLLRSTVTAFGDGRGGRRWRRAHWRRRLEPGAGRIGKAANVVNHIPPLLLAELVAKAGHRRAVDAVGDPIEELPIGVASRHVDPKISRPWPQGSPSRTITATGISVAT